MRLDAHAGRVTGVERPGVVEVRDVVARVPRRREAVQAQDATAYGMHVLFGHRRQLPPEVVERIAVQPSRARFEPAWIDEVGRADGRDVHL